ncbi:hypothetical protein IJ732_04100, partial [bacterium]|nr:hypothetical protein [bacterium]
MQNSQNKELVSHYLKMNNILSNALKNTEATEQTKFYKLSETDFKTKFETHLKTTGCDADAGDTNFTPNVCLADGSQFAYGTFDESCTDNICDTLTIDTNGKKGPNKEGKDRFTMNLTPNGIKATGENDTCKTGLQCGAYILAHHKLFNPNGTVVNCSEYDGGSCTKCNSNTLAVSKTNTCIEGKTLDNGTVMYKMGDYYATPIKRSSSGGTYYSSVLNKEVNNYWQGAYNDCESKGLHLPDTNTLNQIIPYANDSNTIAYPRNCYWTADGYGGTLHKARCIDDDGNITDLVANDYIGDARILCVE